MDRLIEHARAITAGLKHDELLRFALTDNPGALRAARGNRTQYYVARRAGVSVTVVSEVEAGNLNRAGPAVLAKLVLVYGELM